MKQIKICGMKREEDIQMMNIFLPEYCGFIINFPKSHRNLTEAGVRELKKLLSPKVKAVGVFVDSPPELVSGLLNEGTLDVAQLHGKEDNNYIEILKKMTTKPIWQAIQVRSDEDIKRAEKSKADFVLLDAGQGSGETFDWRKLKELKRPFALAGGLKLEKLPEALATEATLLDVSGGVETDKFKDREKVKKFIETVRKAAEND